MPPSPLEGEGWGEGAALWTAGGWKAERLSSVRARALLRFPLPAPPLKGEGTMPPSPLEGEGWGEGAALWTAGGWKTEPVSPVRARALLRFPLPNPPLKGEGIMPPSPLEGEGWGEGAALGTAGGWKTEPLPTVLSALRMRRDMQISLRGAFLNGLG